MAHRNTRTVSRADLTPAKYVRFLAILTVLSSILSGFGAHTVDLAWDASPDSTVAGYKIYYGTSPSSLLSSLDAGAKLTATLTNLVSGSYYFAAASYNSNRVESDLSNIASTNFIDTPVIVAQSANVTSSYGATTNLNVTATGSSLSYEWLFNGAAMTDGGNVSGSTTSSLTFAGAVDANGGNYQVVVSNPAGSVTSSVMTLTVLDAPAIASQPGSLTRNTGATATFSVGATGTAALHYHWTKNGSAMIDGGNVFGSALATLTLNSVSSSDAATYRCTVTNSSGSATSATATLTVITPAAIANQPASQTLNSGAVAIFSVGATGTGPFNYSWTKNGSPLANVGNIVGATTASLTVNNIASGDAGAYAAVVSNGGGSATSSAASLTVITAASITSQPASATANAGSSAAFSVTAQGSQPLTYQWLFNSAPISGATASTLNLNNVQSANAGSYSCTVSNQAGNVISAVASLTVITGPSITSQPVSVTAAAGGSASFTVGADGSQPLVYRWMFNGAPVAGAMSSTLAINNVQWSDAGSYSCTVSNQASTVVSSVAVLNVSGATNTITAQPTNQTLNACDTLTLTVGVSGSTPTYQWMHNGAAIPDATNAVFSIAGVNGNDAGTYYVQVTGDSVLTSSNAVVTVNDPIFLTQPGDNCVSVNATNVFIAQACGASLSYQWYFIPLDSATASAIAGANSASLTVGPATSQNTGQYFCVVTNNFGSITSRAASLGVEVPPTITSQPPNATATAGGSVTFTIAASASAPLTFQWMRNSKNILGATNSSYTIATVQTSDAGTYQCNVGTIWCQSSALSSSTSGHLNVNKAKPNSKFTSPNSNTQYSNTAAEHIDTGSGTTPEIRMSGIASDNGRVADVTVTRTFPPSAPLVFHPTLVGSPTLGYWTNYVALVSGTNTFSAVVTDAAGLSATNTIQVFLRTSSVLHISTVGGGTTSPLTPTTFGKPTNNAVLDIGRNYRVLAKPVRGNVFSNWVDGSGVELSTSATLIFRMQTNLQLTANFVTNPIVANNANGSYNGLFYETNDVRVKSAGAIFNLNVRGDGLFSGTMKLDGSSLLLTGTFDVQGNATKHLVRRGKTTITVALHLDYVAKQITGTVSSPEPDAWTSVLLMDIAPYSSANRFANSARYTLAVPPGTGAPANSPGGFGFGFVTNSAFGVISFVGTLADGTAVSQTVPISQQGYWPFYIPLYRNRGLIQGWLNFSSGSPAGNITWIRPAGALTSSYSNGFTNDVTIFGSPYTPRTPSLTPGDASLDVGLPLLTFPYAVSNNNAVVELSGGPTNYMAGSISAPAGAVTLSYRPTGGSGNLTAHGAVLQWNNAAYGYVISNNISAPLHMH